MKIFENILYNDIFQSTKNKISKNQHGFLPDMSTVTNSLTFSEHAFQAINKQQQLDVIYTDAAKAFDKVDHMLLLDKLVDFGFSQNAYYFIESYLSDRAQVVRVGRTHSKEVTVTSGVPQGSKLGPLLFVLVINDLSECMKESTVLFYADDFKLYKQISCRGVCITLQLELNKVVQWCERNKMFLNIKMLYDILYKKITIHY